MSFLDLRNELLREHDVLVGAIRISVGLATNFADVYRFVCFMQGFVDQTVDEIGAIQSASAHCRVAAESARPPRTEGGPP